MWRMSFKKIVFLMLLFFVWCAIAFIVYWPAIVNFPKLDALTTMTERFFFRTTYDYFIYMLNFNRMVYGWKQGFGDFYLFRPFHMLMLFVADCFRGRLYLIGSFSIIYLAISSFALFLIVDFFLDALFAALLVLLYLLNAAGVEMVFWRHISPYMLGLAFYAFGVRVLLEALKKTTIKIYG